jgi:A/G-specific adenine glycosylase
MMLQQTQVSRVVIKFPEFVAEFPDFATLAAAPLDTVLRAWQGMGYNRRALSLKNCARIVGEDYHGLLPSDVATLATFPGLGRATASSICAFAFNLPVVFIETNIRRVFIHSFFDDTGTVSDTDILPLVAQTLHRQDPRTWYNALMDFGAALKSAVPNPNRRSRQYARQTEFAGSDRKIRGRILKLLLEQGSLTREAIGSSVEDAPSRVDRLLLDLEREGFIFRSDQHISIATR